MSMTARAILVLLTAIVAVTFGNMFLSLAGKPPAEGLAVPAWVRALTRLKSWQLLALGVCGHMAFFLMWIWVLRVLDLSVAVPLTGLCFVLAAVAGYYLLREPMTTLRWLGIALVVAGVVLITATVPNNAPPATESAVSRGTIPPPN